MIREREINDTVMMEVVDRAHSAANQALNALLLNRAERDETSHLSALNDVDRQNIDRFLTLTTAVGAPLVVLALGLTDCESRTCNGTVELMIAAPDTRQEAVILDDEISIASMLQRVLVRNAGGTSMAGRTSTYLAKRHLLGRKSEKYLLGRSALTLQPALGRRIAIQIPSRALLLEQLKMDHDIEPGFAWQNLGSNAFLVPITE